jgi:hypothetical protein
MSRSTRLRCLYDWPGGVNAYDGSVIRNVTLFNIEEIGAPSVDPITSGNDQLDGEGGDDLTFGQGGRDTLHGGVGQDYITNGASSTN